MDPKKLGAFAAAGQQPPGGKGGPPQKGANTGSDKEEKAEGEDPEAEVAEGMDEKFAKLTTLLEANAEDLEANCDEVDPAALTDPDAELAEEDKTIIVESFDALPEDLKAEMVAVLGDIDKETALKLAEHLESEDMITDAERTCGYLVHLGKLIESGDLTVDGEEEGDEEEEPEDDAEEEPEEGESEEA